MTKMKRQDIINACIPILRNVKKHRTQHVFLNAYQILNLLPKQNRQFYDELLRTFGTAVGKGGGKHVGPAQQIANALCRYKSIETRYMRTNGMTIKTKEPTSNPCGIFRIC